jgi:hypothetical protein
VSGLARGLSTCTRSRGTYRSRRACNSSSIRPRIPTTMRCGSSADRVYQANFARNRCLQR